jgi:hypothetical protein
VNRLRQQAARAKQAKRREQAARAQRSRLTKKVNNLRKQAAGAKQARRREQAAKSQADKLRKELSNLRKQIAKAKKDKGRRTVRAKTNRSGRGIKSNDRAAKGKKTPPGKTRPGKRVAKGNKGKKGPGTAKGNKGKKGPATAKGKKIPNKPRKPGKGPKGKKKPQGKKKPPISSLVKKGSAVGPKRPLSFFDIVDDNLKRWVDVGPYRQVDPEPDGGFDSDTVYWVSYLRKGDAPTAGELYGAYKTKAEADKAVAEIRAWAKTIKDPTWQIASILVEKVGGTKKKKADEAPDPRTKALDKYKDLGKLSRKEESGGDPGKISPGYFLKKDTDPKSPTFGKWIRTLDPGGPSYGLYQLSSLVDGKKDPNGGNVGRFVRKYYPDEFKGLEVNTPAFARKWIELALGDPEGFAAKQHEFIAETHYVPLATKLKDNLGFDPDTRSETLRDVLWSTAVQHRGAYKIVSDALRRVKEYAGEDDLANIDDSMIIRAIYYKRMAYYPKGKPRYKRELKAALRALEEERADEED